MKDYRRKPLGLKITSASALLLILLTVVPAMASESSLDIADEAGQQAAMVGLGVAFVPDYEGSDDLQAVPLLQARYSWSEHQYISLLGNTIRMNLVPDKMWHAGPILRYRAERDDVDNSKVDRLRKVDAAVEIGAFGSVNIDQWTFMFTAAKDVSDSHDGYLLDLSGAYKIHFNRQALLTLFASTSYASDDYMESYFKIDANNAARSGLRTYSADGGLKDVAIGGAYQYNIDDQWGLLGVLRYARLLGDAKDSPVVDDEGDAGQLLGGIAVNYRF